MPLPPRQELRTLLSSGHLISDCIKYAKDGGFQVIDLGGGIPAFIYRGGNTKVSMISGLHGNERSGPIFLRAMLRSWSEGDNLPNATLIVVPLINDNGWDHRTREWHGVDLNRTFTDEKKHTNPAIVNLMDLLKEEKPKLHWDLHEDSRFPDCWIYDYSKDKTNLNKRIAEHVGSRTQPWTAMDTITNKGTSEVFARKSKIPFVLTTECSPKIKLNNRLDWLYKVYSFTMREVTKV